MGVVFRISIRFFLYFPQVNDILHSFVTSATDFFLEPQFRFGHIAHTQARSSLKRLLVHREDARGFRRFPRVNCWRVSRNAVTRAGLPGRCGLLRVSACKGGTGLLARTMTADREIRSGALELVLFGARCTQKAHPPLLTRRYAGRGPFALHTARVAGPGRIYFGSLLVCHPSGAKGPLSRSPLASHFSSLFICPILS